MFCVARTYRIAVIAGDGIGTEVVPEGLRVLDAAAAAFDFGFSYEHFDFASADYYARHGTMLPPDWFGVLEGSTRSSSGRSGGPTSCPTTSRCGAACCSFGAASTSTSTCGR